MVHNWIFYIVKGTTMMKVGIKQNKQCGQRRKQTHWGFCFSFIITSISNVIIMYS